MDQKPHLHTGKQGEQQALKYLQQQGWTILATNWRPAHQRAGLELDIVACNDSYLIFIEVKTRVTAGKSYEFSPMATFPPKKQVNMLKAAQLYLTETESWHRPCRMDLIYITTVQEGQQHLEHYTDVIDLGNLMDRGHTTWQPW